MGFIMSVFSRVLREYFLSRCRRIERATHNAVEIQYNTLKNLCHRGCDTIFGRMYNVGQIRSAEQFAQCVDRFDYSSFEDFILRMRRGERYVTSPNCVRMFARSSGSSSSRSKYLPVTDEYMRQNHLRGMADVVSLYLLSNPESRIFEGKTLTLGGSCCYEQGALVGDISALALHSAGRLTSIVRAPRMKVALMENFAAKCEMIAQQCSRERITAFAGVPSWNLAMLRRVLEYTSKHTIKELWPDMELYMHGGIKFTPYAEAYANIMGGEISYFESYNASEGFVAIAERNASTDMLLMPDYGCYYEFAAGDAVVPLEGVRVDQEYSIMMTTLSGLWRYELGDVVRFTSVNPYRLRIVGRTKQFINAFGEELMLANVEQALYRASFMTGAVVSEYTISPIFMPAIGRGFHRWVVEFAHYPRSIERFQLEIDAALRDVNSDYDAKRRSIMLAAEILVVPRGTFERWLVKYGRRKIPRMRADDRVSRQIVQCAEDVKTV